MARNLKRDYIKKLINTVTPNGYKFDLANYLYNPSYDHDYPTFRKTIAEDETTTTYEEVGYFKFYDGTGEYERRTYTMPKEDGDWHVAKSFKKEVLASANRFNLNTLISYC